MISLIFYRQWRYLLLLTMMLGVVGYTSVTSLGRQEDPTITNLFATVLTHYPGATSAQVEALVTEPLEAKLRQIDEIHEINSTSKQNLSVIQIELSSFIDNTRIENVWSEIRDAIAQAERELPTDAAAPVFDNDRAGAYTAIVAVVPKHPDDIAIAHRYALSLQDQLRLIPNTKLVRTFGMNDEVINVQVDLDRLHRMGISLASLADIIGAHDVKQSAGRIDSSRSNLLLQVNNQFNEVADVMSIPLQAAAGGSTAQLREIATVHRELSDPLTSLAFVDDHRAVLVGARMQADKQVHVWSGNVSSKLTEFEQQLPENLSLVRVFNQNNYTTAKINNLLTNLCIGIALVIFILLLTMGWRVAFIVATIIPLASLLTMVVFRFIDMTIHQMSITGLIVSLGLLVDSAIVMTDEVQKRLRTLPVETAIIGAVKRLLVPLSASTLTTILAFMPMAMLPGPSGDFVGSIAVSVIVMLLASLLLSLLLTPAIAGHMFKRFPQTQTGYTWQLRIALPFRKSLHWAYSHKRWSVPLALLLPLAGFLSLPGLSAQFFPGVDRNQFYIEVQFAEMTSLMATAEQVSPIVEYVQKQAGVESVSHIVGESFPAFYYNMRSDKDATPSYAQLYVETSDAQQTDRLIEQLQPELTRSFPAAAIVVRKLNQGPPVDAPIEIRITGANVAILQQLGEQLRLRLANIEAVTSTRSSLTSGTPAYQLNLDAASIRALGMTPAEVTDQVRLATIGHAAGFILEDTVVVPVWLKAAGHNRASISQALTIPVLTPLGTTVPLDSIAQTDVVPTDGVITRRNSERINKIQAFTSSQVLPDVVFRKIKASLDEEPLVLPAGYHIAFGGDAGERAETLRNLVAVLGLVISLTIVTIVATFNSFKLSSIVFSVCVFSVGLSLLSLAVTGYPLGIQAIIGLIGAIGVSVNAAIIILTSLQTVASQRPLSLTLVVEQVMYSSKHITSTTLTTFFGFLPLILEGGGFWPPFAVAVAGGVLLSVIISFYLVPSMFILLCRNEPTQSFNKGDTH